MNCHTNNFIIGLKYILEITMEFLIDRQIQDSCRLAMPEGLKDLMSDISREVLRAQPSNLLEFITNYLSVLLVTRENLTTATTICDDICEDVCALGLEDELREIGISEEDTKAIIELVDKHLEETASGNVVKESNLMSKIIRKTSIPAEKMMDILEAVRKAFVRYQKYNTTIYESDSTTDIDSITYAAQHTLDLYRKTKPTDNQFEKASETIQAAYRAYGVRRHLQTEKAKIAWSYAPEIINRAELEEESDTAGSKPHHITFDADDDQSYNADTESRFADTQSVATNQSEKTDDIYVQYTNASKPDVVSSCSLAGSFIQLPQFKPYRIQEEPLKESVNDEEVTEEEIDDSAEKENEKENFNVDYTKEDSIIINKPVIIPFDYEIDDTITESSIDEDFVDRKVVIDTNVEILADGENEKDVENQIEPEFESTVLKIE